MKKIYNIKEIPEGEMIQLSKDRFGWRVVHPIRNNDGSFNWFNLIVGSWNNLILLLFILVLIGGFFLAYHEVASQLSNCMEQVQPIIKVPSLFIP